MRDRTIELLLNGLLTGAAVLFSVSGASLRANAVHAADVISPDRCHRTSTRKSPGLLQKWIKLKPTRCGRWTKPRSIVKDRSILWGN
jgi:hypothetical protein